MNAADSPVLTNRYKLESLFETMLVPDGAALKSATGLSPSQMSVLNFLQREGAVTAEYQAEKPVTERHMRITAVQPDKLDEAATTLADPARAETFANLAVAYSDAKIQWTGNAAGIVADLAVAEADSHREPKLRSQQGLLTYNLDNEGKLLYVTFVHPALAKAILSAHDEQAAKPTPQPRLADVLGVIMKAPGEPPTVHIPANDSAPQDGTGPEKPIPPASRNPFTP